MLLNAYIAVYSYLLKIEKWFCLKTGVAFLKKKKKMDKMTYILTSSVHHKKKPFFFNNYFEIGKIGIFLNAMPFLFKKKEEIKIK